MADISFLQWPFFQDTHRALAETASSWAKTQLDRIPSHDEYEETRRLVRILGENGFLKYTIPAPYGGNTAKLDVRSICLLRETFSYFSAIADFSFVMQGLGAGPISLFGSEEQKNHYLKKVANGEYVAAFALSEEEAGSDVAALRMSAKLSGNEYILNGTKCWISNAGIADFYTVFARTEEAPGAKGLSAFVVDAKTPGLKTEKIDIISPHPLGKLVFNNCKIPQKNLIGTSGDGFKIAMSVLDIFRSGVGAAALGFARRALDESVGHAKKRKLFGQDLSDFQMTKERIADMATDIDASALLVYRAAWQKDNGAERITREAAMAKMFATEASQRVIDKAVQMLGGLGVVSGNIVERLYRDIRPLRIYEGTTEIQKLIIAQQTINAQEK